MLTAYYDLSTSPPTYDFVSFLLAAEMTRLQGNHDSLRIRILPGPVDGFRTSTLPPKCPHARRRMLQAIVAPLAQLLPSCVDCSSQDHRGKVPGDSIGYGTKMYGVKRLLEAAHANVYPLRALGTPPQGDYVTITLREASYWPSRNSNVGEWLKVADYLRRQGREVIFVRDTERADEPLNDHETAPRASVDLLHRAHLYAGAALNLFTNNGPAWMCLFMQAPCAVFKMIAPGAPMASAAVFTKVGLPPGSQWPNAAPDQFISWAMDDAQEIIPVVDRLLCRQSGFSRSPAGGQPTLTVS